MAQSIAIAAAAALLLASVAADAGDLQPIQAGALDLGAVSGTAYYTSEADGFHVVATVAGSDDTPTRVEVVLAPGARVVLSSAGLVGTAPRSVAIVHRHDRLSIEPVVAAFD